VSFQHPPTIVVGNLVFHALHGQGRVESVGDTVKVKSLKRKGRKKGTFFCKAEELRLLRPGEHVEGESGADESDFWSVGDFVTTSCSGQGSIMELRDDGTADIMLADGEIRGVKTKDVWAVNMGRVVVAQKKKGRDTEDLGSPLSNAEEDLMG